MGVPNAERELLDRDFTEVLSAAALPLDENKPDEGNILGSARAILAVSKLAIKDLTPAEKQFLGRYKAPSSINVYQNIWWDAYAFRKYDGGIPRNAAQLALSSPDPEKYVLDHPELINPATGRLYADFSQSEGPLGVKLVQDDRSFLRALFRKPGSHTTFHCGEIIVLRENGTDILLDETVR